MYYFKMYRIKTNVGWKVVPFVWGYSGSQGNISFSFAKVFTVIELGIHLFVYNRDGHFLLGSRLENICYGMYTWLFYQGFFFLTCEIKLPFYLVLNSIVIWHISMLYQYIVHPFIPINVIKCQLIHIF